MPGTTRKTTAKAAAPSEAATDAVEGQEDAAAERPTLTVSDVQDFLVDFLNLATLRDATELVPLRARLTGEEVPESADEESADEGGGA